jgi:hypothetical protein
MSIISPSSIDRSPSSFLPAALGPNLRDARIVVFGRKPASMELPQTALRGGIPVLILREDRTGQVPSQDAARSEAADD